MHRRRVVWVAAIAFVSATLLTSTTAVAATKAPDEWDSRVERFVRFVERERGLEFDHPVKVDFLGEKAFRRAASSWYDEITDKDRELAALDAATLLALGLVTQPVDLLAAEESSDVEGTLGFYDDETGELVVRGTDLDDTEVQLTIVHELAHALQDQNFDLGKLQARADGGGEYAGLRALIEGDATLVEREYLWSLPQRVQDDYWDSFEDAGASEQLAPVDETHDPTWPLVLDLWSAVDYDLAPTALELVIAAHGRRAIDALFRSPPVSEEQIVDPVALEEGDEPVPVKMPSFAPGDVPSAHGYDWGAYSWYLVLASRIPWPQALTAVEGWGGDRYRNFTRTTADGAQECVRMAVTGDTRRDTDELEAAITDWAAAMPVGGTSITRDEGLVVLDACPTLEPPTSGDEAMQLGYDRLWERTDQLWYVLDGLPPDEYSRCLAVEVVANEEIEPLLYVDRDLTKAEERAFDDALDDAFESCA